MINVWNFIFTHFYFIILSLSVFSIFPASASIPMELNLCTCLITNEPYWNPCIFIHITIDRNSFVGQILPQIFHHKRPATVPYGRNDIN